MVFSPDDTRLASASTDKTIRLWDSRTGREIQTLRGHTKEVTALAFSFDGSLIASDSSDKTVRLWNFDTSQEIRRLQFSEQIGVGASNCSTFSVGFAPNAELLTLAPAARLVQWWDSKTGEEIHNVRVQHDLIEHAALSSNGAVLALVTREHIACIWDCQTGREVLKLKLPKLDADTLDISGDLCFLALSPRDHTLRLWDLRMGQEVQKFEGHDEDIVTANFSPTGAILASASKDRTVRLWDMKTSGTMHVLSVDDLAESFERSLTFSQDGLFLVVKSRNGLHLWSSETGQQLLNVKVGLGESICAHAFSPDDSLIAWATRDLLSIRDRHLETERTLQRPPVPNSEYTELVFSPDSSLLVSTSENHIEVWNTRTGDLQQRLSCSHVDTIAFCPTTSLLASLSSDDVVQLWDLETGLELQRLDCGPGKGRGFHGETFVVMDFSRDGSLLTLARSQKVQTWNASTWQEVQEFDFLPNQILDCAFSLDHALCALLSSEQKVHFWNMKPCEEVQMLGGLSETIVKVALSFDGTIFASMTGNQKLRLYDSRTGQRLSTVSGSTKDASEMTIAPNMDFLAFVHEDNTIRVLRLKTSEEIQKLDGHSGRVSGMAFSRDGSLLASASSDTTVRLWEIGMDLEERGVKGCAYDIKQVIFSPDGTLIASLCSNSILLFDRVKGKVNQELKTQEEVITMLFSPDSSILVSACWDDRLKSWNTRTGQELQEVEVSRSYDIVLEFAPDSSSIAFVSDRRLRLWNPRTGQALSDIGKVDDSYPRFAFSPDGILFAYTLGKAIQLRNLSSRQFIEFSEELAEEPAGQVSVLTFSSDCKLLASSSQSEDFIRIWSVETGRVMMAIHAYHSHCTTLFFSITGNLLVGQSYDTTQVWDLSTGNSLKWFFASPSHSLYFSEDEKFLITDRGAVRIDDTDTTVDASKPVYVLSDEWFQCNDRNCLWLPHDYRPRGGGCVAYHNGTFAIGTNSGRVCFFEFR